jgi:hypothetical protein
MNISSANRLEIVMSPLYYYTKLLSQLQLTHPCKLMDFYKNILQLCWLHKCCFFNQKNTTLYLARRGYYTLFSNKTKKPVQSESKFVQICMYVNKPDSYIVISQHLSLALRSEQPGGAVFIRKHVIIIKLWFSVRQGQPCRLARTKHKSMAETELSVDLGKLVAIHWLIRRKSIICILLLFSITTR